MKITFRMRITLLTGIIIIIASLLLTFASIYNAQNKIMQALNSAADLTVKAELLDSATTAIPAEKIGSALPVNPELKGTTTIEAYELMKAYEVPAVVASRQFNYVSFVFMGAVSILGMIVAYYMAGRTLRPVNELNEAILDISEKNLKQRLTEDCKGDEISSLTHSFNGMLDRLEDSFWRQKRFSSNAAHELKTPLATMKTGLQVLELSEEPTVEECKEIMDIAGKQINRLINMVDDLLIFTNQGYEEPLEPICLGAVLLEITKELGPLCQAKDVTMECRGVEEGWLVLGNETLTYRLFYNLVENAIKYNRRTGQINIVIDNDADHVENVHVRIYDTGMGMENNQLKKIFEPFYCIDTSRSRKLGGSGLGLAIVKDIIERYGWEIKVDSKLGTGTVFEVSIPVEFC